VGQGGGGGGGGGGSGGGGGGGGGGDASRSVWLERVSVRLRVLPSVIEQSGDSEPWRLSRLRWLDSRAGKQSKPGRGPDLRRQDEAAAGRDDQARADPRSGVRTLVSRDLGRYGEMWGDMRMKHASVLART